MSKRSGSSIFWDEAYVRLTQRPLNSLAFVFVPLAVYQFYAIRYGTPLLAPRDLGKVLHYFGASAAIVPPLLILGALLVQHFFSPYPWSIQPIALGGMLAESVFWTLPVMGLSYLTSRVLAAMPALSAGLPPGPPTGLAQSCLQALGAGIYEEFIFRLVFVGGAILVLTRVLDVRRDISAVATILAGGILFSLYHFSPAHITAATFPWGPFIFRALAGVYLGGLYVLRGFGIAVGTHTVWNIWVAYLSS